MRSTLALAGGPKTITQEFEPYRSIGEEEVQAAAEVVRSGVLSRFIGAWNPDFYGGPRVREFEAAWAAHFRARHAVSVNSATSGLIAALGAVGVEPGDEVIVSPWTMSASATSILVWNAIPVFADIEGDFFGLDPHAVEAAVTARTRAIVVPDIFGHAACLDEIMAIARRYNLRVIEDAAQAPNAIYRGSYAGTVADVGVFSLNYHKHIHTGEGGVCVTNDPLLAERMQLIRNHAEAVASGRVLDDLSNMVGFNFRMTEIEAAIGIEQLRKLERLTAERRRAAERLREGLRGLPGLRAPPVGPDCTHVYYVFGMIVDPESTGVSRDLIVRALQAEGVPALTGAYANIHLLPIFQRRIAYGRSGFPWTSHEYGGQVDYRKGTCPMAEELQAVSYMGIEMCAHRYDDAEIDQVITAFRKVFASLDQLAQLVTPRKDRN
jgi:perosamine synthetase